MSGTLSHEEQFAKIYNNNSKYPTIRDVALALGRSKKTVRNYSSILRRRKERGEKVPDLIWRGAEDKTPSYAKKAEITPRQHAKVRAETLAQEVQNILVASNYPVINPEAMVIQSHVQSRYDRVAGKKIDTEGTPRTWLTDTLRVAGIKDPHGRSFIFSGAQNDTPVDKPFWNNLKAYAEAINAEIIIGPWTYETNWWDENNPASRQYDPIIVPHLCFGQMEIGDNFIFAGEMNTLPTASRPISDLTTYSRGKWAVFPHAKLQLISVPAINPWEQAFQLMTTGAVTRPRVIPRKAGIKSIFNHVLGATIVEFDDDGLFFCRQIIADKDGNFQDLDVKVRQGRVLYGQNVLAMTAADIHIAKLDRINAINTFGYDPQTRKYSGDGKSIIETLRPKNLILHDLHDHESRNHHNANDVSHNYEMAIRGRESVLDELRRASDFLEKMDRPGMKTIVVESNHDLALERYIREARYRNDGINFRLGLQLDAAYHDYREKVAQALDSSKRPPDFSMVEYAIRDVIKSRLMNTTWVYDGGSYIIDDIQVGNHGFRGANGAKGTVTGFARLGQKMTIGDKHSPTILDGVYVAGVMQLQHGYNKGLSGWAVAHVIQYDNGARALITMQQGRWRKNVSRCALNVAA